VIFPACSGYIAVGGIVITSGTPLISG
jgi:hypothetical protein